MEMDLATEVRTDFADRGRQIDNDVFREVHRAVRLAIAGIPERTWEVVGVAASEDVGVDLDLELPDQSAGRLGRALAELDLAWRLGQMAVGFEEPELPSSGGSTNLDELLSVALYGLEIQTIEMGSIKTLFRRPKMSFGDALAVLGIVIAMGGFSVNDTLLGETERVGGDSCQIELVGGLDEEARRVIQEQLPGMPGDCQVKMTITLPDGRTIVTNVPASVLPDS